jgi:hypothetical protein
MMMMRIRWMHTYMRELNASDDQVEQVDQDLTLSPRWRQTSGGGGIQSEVRNRRYNKMKQLQKAGTFFSEDAMKARSPALFHQYLGEYATRLDGLCGAGYDKEYGPKLSDTFLHTIDREVAQGRQRAEEQKWGLEPGRHHPRPDCAQVFGVMSDNIAARQQMGQAYNAAEALAILYQLIWEFTIATARKCDHNLGDRCEIVPTYMDSHDEQIKICAYTTDGRDTWIPVAELDHDGETSNTKRKYDVLFRAGWRDIISTEAIPIEYRYAASWFMEQGRNGV